MLMKELNESRYLGYEKGEFWESVELTWKSLPRWKSLYAITVDVGVATLTVRKSRRS